MRLRKREFALFAWLSSNWDIGLLLPLSLCLDWNYTVRSPGSPACQLQILGFLSIYNHMRTNSLLSICLSIYLSIYFSIFLLVLFFWGTQTNTRLNLNVISSKKPSCLYSLAQPLVSFIVLVTNRNYLICLFSYFLCVSPSMICFWRKRTNETYFFPKPCPKPDTK